MNLRLPLIPMILALVGTLFTSTSLFAFDSEFYRSIGPLLLNPGKLSLTFTEGKRQHYMLPVRMFIVIIILFLTVNSINKGFGFNDSRNSRNPISFSDDVDFIGNSIIAPPH